MNKTPRKSRAVDPEYIDRIEAWLDPKPRSDRYSYGDVGRALGYSPRTVANAMRELGKRGREDLCAMVVYNYMIAG